MADVTIFLDTNVLLDFLVNREPFGENAKAVFRLAEESHIKIYTSVLSMVTTHYILKSYYKQEESDIRSTFLDMETLLTVLDTRNTHYQEALQSDMPDFEDAIQIFTALDAPAMKAIVTRNKKDFTNAKLPVFTPEEFLDRWKE